MTNAEYKAQTNRIESDFPVMVRAASPAKHVWKHAYNEAVRAGVVVLVDIRTRQMGQPWRG